MVPSCLFAVGMADVQLHSWAASATTGQLGAWCNPSWMTPLLQMELRQLLVLLWRVSWCLGWQVPVGTYPFPPAPGLLGVSSGRD